MQSEIYSEIKIWFSRYRAVLYTISTIISSSVLNLTIIEHIWSVIRSVELIMGIKLFFLLLYRVLGLTDYLSTPDASYLFQLIWSLIVPLTISLLAVVMVCPTTIKWVLRQVAPHQELVVSKFIESLQTVVPGDFWLILS